MEGVPDMPRAVAVRVRAVLQAQGHLEGAVRVATEGEIRGQDADCQVEEERLREAVLSAVHSEHGDGAREHVHLPGAAVDAGEEQRRRGGRVQEVRALRMQRLRKHGLRPAGSLLG